MTRGYRRAGGLLSVVALLVATLLVAMVPGAPAAAATQEHTSTGELYDESGFDWESRFYGPGLDTGDSAAGSGGAAALAVWDDGTGPALYVGGWTITAGGHEVNRIAKWDGTDWSPLSGPDGTGVWMAGSGNPSVKALAVYDGDLIAAGFFDRAGGVPVGNIARWDGTTWSPLGDGLTGSIGVEALTVYDGELIAGGHFTASGDQPVNRVARWDGEQWSPLAEGIPSNQVFALGTYGGELYAGGGFSQAGGVAADRIARWDGQSWSPVGGGVNNFVRSFTVYDGALVVGGSFTSAGDQPVSRVARWDGEQWSPLGAGVDGTGNVTVFGMTTYDGELVAAGNFREAGGDSVNFIARWDGTDWLPLSGPAGTGLNNGVSTVLAYDGALVAGSSAFRIAGGVVVNYLARWDGEQWSAVSSLPGTGLAAAGSGFGTVRALVIWNGDLVAAGDFAFAGQRPVTRIARWDGATWTPLPGTYGMGAGSTVTSLAVYQGDLIAGGLFTNAGGLAISRVARFDGQEWSPLSGPEGEGASAAVTALAVYDGDLIVGGSFTTAGGVAAPNLARWDGTGWSALGGGTNNSVHSLTVHDGRLVVGGFFTEAGGMPANRVASWDGTAWSPLGGGVNNTVSALAVHDGDLYAGGNFTQAGGQTVNRVARWDGAAWSPLAGPDGTGVDNSVTALGSYAGALYVGGRFATAGGVPVSQIARWDGSGWSALAGRLGTGVGGVGLPTVSALLPFDPDGDGPLPEQLTVGGTFHTAGGLANWGLASYGPSPELTNLTVSPARLDFGRVPAGELAGLTSVQLTSTGNQPVEVSSVPAPQPPFAESGRDCPATPFTLAPGESCTIGYDFAPTSGGDYQQTLSIGTGGSAAPASLELVGTGLAAPPVGSVNPPDLAVEVTTGEQGTAPVEIINQGEADLTWQVRDHGFDGGAGPGVAPPGESAGSAGTAEPGNQPGRAGGSESGQTIPGAGLPGAESGELALPGLVAPEPATPTAGGDGTVVLSHSESMRIDPGHAISCTNLATGHTRGAQFLRTFPLADFDIHDEFLVTDVTLGVQAARPELAASVNLYTLDGPLRYENLTPIGSRPVTAGPDQSEQLVTVPVGTLVPAGATLVVEVATDDLLGTGWFYPGANDQGETAPSYFAAPACGLPEPTRMADVGSGFPDVHLVMSVTGRDPVDCQHPTWLSVNPGQGTTPGGGTSELMVSFDASALDPGAYQATLCLESNDPTGSLTVLPVEVTVTEPADPVVCDETIIGVHAGPLTVSEGTTCLAAGAHVLGEVNVLGGAGLISTAAAVQGPISAVGATVLDLSFTQVTGPVLVSGATHTVSLFANQVTGSVNLVANNTGDRAIVVSGNTIIGALSCFDNQPLPTHLGLPNTATAGKLGQCAEL